MANVINEAKKMYGNDYIKARVYVTERTTKDGGKFNVYKILETATHKRVDLRFTRACTPPTEDCILVVHKDKINKDLNRDYPCYWVKEIADILPVQLSTADVTKYFIDNEDSE